MLVRLSKALAPVDNAVTTMGLCSGFVFALPPECDAAALCSLVENLREATRRVVAKWALLRGRPEWLDDEQVWAVRVPDDLTTEDKPYMFTSRSVQAPYAVAAGLSSPPALLSPTSPSAFQPNPNVTYFRPSTLPATFRGYADADVSLLAVQVTTFVDAVAVGLSAPHGLFDATGLGYAVRALSAELRGEAWRAPALSTDNVLDQAIEALPRTSSSVVDGLPGWAPATSIGVVIRFLINYAAEKLWHRDEKKYLFINALVVDKLVQSVKDQAAAEGERVSRGDVLTAWVLKSAHVGDGGKQVSIAGSAVYTLRKLLPLGDYPHNAMLPYPLTTSPISLDHLSSLSLVELASLHRRALEAARTRQGPHDVIKKMQEAPLVPDHPWPSARASLGRCPTSAVFRWMSSNQMSSGVADLALPLTAFGLQRPRVEAQPTAGVMAYYMLVVSGIQDHQVFRFQDNDNGVFLEGSMRRSRWESIEKAVQDLERS